MRIIISLHFKHALLDCIIRQTAIFLKFFVLETKSRYFILLSLCASKQARHLCCCHARLDHLCWHFFRPIESSNFLMHYERSFQAHGIQSNRRSFGGATSKTFDGRANTSEHDFHMCQRFLCLKNLLYPCLTDKQYAFHLAEIMTDYGINFMSSWY